MASSGKSLEEMLCSDVDENAFSALVGSLETQLEPTITNSVTQSGHIAPHNLNHMNPAKGQLNCALENDNCNSSVTTVNQSSNNLNNNSMIISNSSPSNSSLTPTNPLTSSSTITTALINAINNTESSPKRITVNAINNAPIGALNNNNNKSSSTPSSTILTSNLLPGALPASGYINQVTNPSSTPVVNAMPANQIIQNAFKVTALSNGNSSPLQSSATIPSTTIASSLTRPSTTIALSALQPSLVITPNKTSSGMKPQQTLLIATTKDGPLIVHPSANPQSSGSDNVSNPTTSAVLTIASRPIVSQANISSSGTGAGVTGQNIVHHVMSNANPILQLVTNVNPNSSHRPSVVNANLQQKTLAPRVVQLPSNVRLTQQVIRPGSSMPGTITLPSNLVRAGTIFLKAENGQVHMVNVGQQINSTSTGATSGNIQGTTYRFQMPAGAGTAQTGIRNLGPQIMLPVSMANALQNKAAQQSQVQLSQPLTIQTSTANAQSATTPSQMSPNTAKKKCKNFLSTLIRLASDQPEQVANNVKNLIQGLIDDAIQPEDFTNQLQRELNSSPQPCLVPFLKKSLPYLRYSLMQRELTIDGVRPPPPGAVTLPQPQAIPQIQIAQTARAGMTPTTAVRLLTPITGGITLGPQGTMLTTPLTHTAQRLPTPQTPHHKTPTAASSSSRSASKSSSKSRSPAAAKEKEKKGFSSSLRDDDDINDVAAMGGVNLQEESQRILASNSEMIGQQIRSCKDENFLFTTPLHTRINKIVSKYGLEEASPDVVSLVSHAVQERLKTLVEKLGAIAEHRQEQLKNDSKYEVTQDVKAQIQFLQELDRLEKRKHEEQEREVLMRAAKSRSKAEDPEQLRLKQKAKELQRQEMEELRQKEANETALQAIGMPWKRLKTSVNSSPSSNTSLNTSSNLNNNFNQSPMFGLSPLKPIKRVKRVSIRDLHFLMEQERETIRSPLLYKAYAK